MEVEKVTEKIFQKEKNHKKHFKNDKGYQNITERIAKFRNTIFQVFVLVNNYH